MSNFLFRYHGGDKPESEDEGAEAMAAWGSWLGNLGAAAVDPGNPVGLSSTVHPDGSVTGDGGPNPTSGYSIVEADSLEKAIEHAKDCPILQGGGSVEVAEIINIDL